MSSSYKLAGIIASCAVALSALPAAAQDTTDQHSSEAARGDGTAAQILMDDIVVRARKKSGAERAQDVPIALTSISGAQIEASFASTLTDIGQSIPNVRFEDAGAFPGVANFSIRGMGFNSTIASVEPTVGLVVDGMYVAANQGAILNALDLESVEVLRGPQGTLFGRNVTGGVVLVRTRRPTGEFGGVARAGIGNGGLIELAEGLEGPVTDTLAFKAFVSWSKTHGLWNNVTTGGHHGANNTVVARPMLRWRPNSRVDITLIGEYGKTDGDGVSSRFINDPNQLLYQQGVREPLGGAKNLSINYKGRTDITWRQAILDTNINIGSGTLTSLTGYRKVGYASSGDTDGSELDVAEAFNSMDQHQFSEELRYAGQAFDGKLDYTIGAYYLEQRIQQFYHVHFFGASNQRSGGILRHKTWSVFAQGDYKLLPDVFLTLGGRYTWERKQADNARTPDCDLMLNCTFTDSGSTKWKNFSPKVGLNWKATDDIMLYASWTKAFRSGGYNIRTTGANESAGPYDEETVKSLEGGIKTTWLNGRARANLSVFHNKFSGLQRTVNDGLVNYIANVASATINGGEFEAALLPFPNLVITGSVGYLDAHYDDYLLPGSTTNLAGRRLVRAPKWTWAASITHDLDLASAGKITSRVSLSYTAPAPVDDPGNYFSPSYHLLDASIGWSPAQLTGLELSIWAKNLTNKTYAQTATYVGTLFTNLYQAPPRNYGLQATFKF